MNLDGTRFTYNIVLKSIQKDADKIMDNLVLKESLKNAQGNKMLADEIEPIRRLLDDVKASDLELGHDMRSHYIVSKIEARAQKGMYVSELLSALMPPATMTGTPKFEVNNWLKRVEPESRYAYTGVIGYINGDGRAKFSQAVRIMMLKQNIAHVYAGSNIEPDLDPEREYTRTSQLALSLSREINTHSQA
jgi:isochorismate synthase EntC